MRFSLRTLLIVVTVAGPLVAIGQWALGGDILAAALIIILLVVGGPLLTEYVMSPRRKD